MNQGRKQLAPALLIAWALIVLISLGWNIHHTKQSHLQFLQDNARLIFKHILLVRHWNALHGGVYVRVSEHTQPNEYLDHPDRDIKTLDGEILTLINPAYMTRQIADLAESREGIRLHITSLDPIRPQNQPSELEREALLSFESGETDDFIRLIESDKEHSIFYMGALTTTQACLRCHEKQGYKEGDIRGGISVTLPNIQPAPIQGMIIAHTVIGLIGITVILTLLRKLSASYEQVHRLSRHDALTGIPNRRYFNERLQDEYKRAGRNRSPITLLLCDIDYFKRFNDILGHLEGDDCLVKVATAIKESLQRGGDQCARIGGEEFIVILPDTNQSGGLKVAERLQRNISSLNIHHPDSSICGHVTISIGIATESQNYPSEVELIKRADVALYRSKHNGRNRIERDENEVPEAVHEATD